MGTDKAQIPGAKPNMVFIFAGNLGYRDLGSYGNKIIKKPNLDRMAARGMRLTDFYSAFPICSLSPAKKIQERIVL